LPDAPLGCVEAQDVDGVVGLQAQLDKGLGGQPEPHMRCHIGYSPGA